MAFTVNFRIVIEFCACKHENVKITRFGDCHAKYRWFLIWRQ